MKRKVLAIILVVVMVAALVPTAAFAAGNSGTNNNYVGGVGVKVDKNNANFHCNAFGGNGRVWPEQAINKDTGVITKHDFKKTPFMFYFDRVGATTKWTLNHVKDEKGATVIGSVICPNCGSTQWISFSNNSGAPDGKNIQLQHPLTSIKIVKKWLDAEGKTINGASVKFEINYNVDGRTGKLTVGPGEVKNLPAGTYVIKELDIKNYTLIDILTRAGFEVDLDEKTATIVITPEMALADDIVTVTYTNKEDPHVLIEKDWADGNPGSLTALFDIYELGECEDDCEEDCKIPHLGDLVEADVRADRKVFVGYGTYVVAEQDKAGYVAQLAQMVTVDENNRVGKFAFVNEPEEFFGSFTIDKTVSGVAFASWLLDDYLAQFPIDEWDGIIEELKAGISFKLFAKDGTFIADAEFDLFNGTIFFDPQDPDIIKAYFDKDENLLPGDYYIVEYLTGLAAKVFKNADGEVVLEFTIGAGGEAVGGGVAFDKNAAYRCDTELAPRSTETRVANAYWQGGKIVNNDWVNNYKVEAVDGPTAGAQYLSFCSCTSSTELGGDGTYRYLYYDKTAERFAGAEAYKKQQIINAFDYIVDTWGNIDEWLAFKDGGPWGEEYTDHFRLHRDDWKVPTKYIAQIVNWKLLVDELIPEDVKAMGPNGCYQAIFDFINECVDAAWAAGLDPAYKNTGHITDIVFLANEDYTYTNLNGLCQPQIIPLTGGLTFNNEPEDEEFYGSFTIEKTVNGIEFADWLLDDYLAQFDPDDWMDIIEELLAGISFKLFAKDGTFISDAELTTGGLIFFETEDEDICKEYFDKDGKLLPGDYYIIEYLTGLAKTVFTNVDGEVILEFTVGAGGEPAGGTGDGFNPAGTYWFDTAAYNKNGALGSDGFGDFHVTDGTDSWSSFCAMFGVGTDPNFPLEANDRFEGNKEEVIKAFNYIYDTWGSIDQWPKDLSYPDTNYIGSVYRQPIPQNATKAIAQIVLWRMMGETGYVCNDSWVIDGMINAAVEQVMAEYMTTPTGNNIQDVIFLAYIDNGGRIHGSQPQLVPLYGRFTFDNGTPDDFFGKIIAEKVINGENIQVWVDYDLDYDFSQLFYFELWSIAAPGAALGTLIGTADVTPLGSIFFEEDLAPGWYAVVERFTTLGAAIFDKNVATRLDVEVVENVSPTDAGTFRNKVLPGPSYGSVTATNDAGSPLIVPNSNHFTYAMLNRTDLEKGVTLDMVVGNKIDKVGEVFVQLVDGAIVITLEGSGSFGAVASASLFNPGNGNIHSESYFNHNNAGTIACPDGDVIYLYIHCSAWRFPVPVPNLA